MNKTIAILSITPILLALACGKHEKPSPSASTNRNSAQGTAQTAPTGAPAPVAAQPEGSPQPATRPSGTYEVAEVHSGGVISIMTRAKTSISFLRDGTYSRVTTEPPRPVHSDAGEYRIDGNKLVLMIKMSGGTIFNPPREVTHTFELSPDGEELKLTSAKGNVAVFHRKSNAS